MPLNPLDLLFDPDVLLLDPPEDDSGFSPCAALGGWLGIIGPAVAGAVGAMIREAAHGRPVPVWTALGFGLVCFLASAFLAYLTGWAGGALSRWLQRRRETSWDDGWREFVGAWAVWTALWAGLAAPLALAGVFG